jgi:type I restriction enzyme S subunit
LFRLKSAFDSTFYAKILSSPDVVHYLEEHATGTTMKNLNEDIVQRIPVPFVTAEMQKKITMNIDRKMSVCDSIEQTVNTTLQQAEAMRQSILKDAFEGRL